MKILVNIIALLCFTFALLSCQSSVSTEKSLYERLGGVYSIATVVDDFIERLLVNGELNANTAINESRKRLPKAGLKFRVTALLCQVSGGPQQYTGRTLKVAHAKLNISEMEWKYMMDDFKTTLDKFRYPISIFCPLGYFLS